jgi:hypothetical protein
VARPRAAAFLAAAYGPACRNDVAMVAQYGRKHTNELLDQIGMTGMRDVQIEDLAHWLPRQAFLCTFA